MRRLFKRIACIVIATVIMSSMIVVFTASAVSLDIEVYMDNCYVTKNGQPTAWTTKLTELTSGVDNLYTNVFGIDLDFNFVLNSSHIVTSKADDCTRTNKYTDVCTHTFPENCSNTGSLHHTNGKVLLNAVPTITPNNSSAVIVFTSSYLCWKNSSGNHKELFGLAVKPKHRLLVREKDTGSPSDSGYWYYSRATVAHEIGHLFGVADHYDTRYGDSRDNCIWGANKDTNLSVRRSMTMCATCQAKLREKNLIPYS